MDFLSDPNIIAVTGFVSDAAKTSLSEKLIIVGVVWWAMGGKIKGLKKEVTSGLDRICDEISDLKKTVANDLSMQASRLGNVESGINNLNSRVSSLEKPKGVGNEANSRI